MSWIVPDTAFVTPLTYMLVALAATLLIGFSKSGFGGGVGVLATPLLLLALPGNVALSIILPLLIICDLFTLTHFPRQWNKRSYWLLMPGTLMGFFAGFAFLLCFASSEGQGEAGERWIRLVVGTVSLVFCALKVFDPLIRKLKDRKPGEKDFRPGLAIGLAIGLPAGFSTVIAHAAGPLVTMFLLPQRLTPQDFVGTSARYYLTVNLLKVPLYILTGLIAQRDFITFQTLKWNLWLVPFCPVGVALGAWLNRRLGGRIFTFVIYILLFLTGIKMIAG